MNQEMGLGVPMGALVSDSSDGAFTKGNNNIYCDVLI